MKANELRIGNLINYRIVDKTDERQEWIEVSEIDYNDLRILGIKDETNQDYQPIPLTKEWLLKFGFITTQWDNCNSHRLMIGNNDFTIVIYSDGNCEVGDIMLLKCEHVHQLQNLYFALTREELIIK